MEQVGSGSGHDGLMLHICAPHQHDHDDDERCESDW